MKITLNEKEAAERLKEAFALKGVITDIVIDNGELSKEQKLDQLNNYWKSCIHAYDVPVFDKAGFRIYPAAGMKIPLIKLYRSMYKLVTGKDCSLAQAKAFVDTHQ